MTSGISVIIFGRNCGEDFQKTINEVELLARLRPYYDFELVLVDDASDSVPSWKVDYSLFSSVHTKILPKRLGISGAIHSGIHDSTKENLMWLPGSNMYGHKAMMNLLDASQNSDLVLGYRVNLYTARPPIKLFFSLVLRAFMHLLTFHFVADFKGLNLYKTNHVRTWLEPSAEHGGDLILLTHILLFTNKVTQVPTPILESHNKRDSKKVTDNFPSLRASMSAVRGMIKAARIYRSSRIVRFPE